MRLAVRCNRWTGTVVFAGYALLAVAFLGLPLLVEGGSRYVGFGYDPQIFIWSFAWWPHAILHGQNPFVTHAVWAPGGLNLTWATSVPGLALLFSPLTLIVGPVVSYNVAAILMPAVAAWTAFALCRYLTRALWPSLVGGYLFGFSSYLMAQAGEGHLHLSSVFLLPLAALLILRFLDGSLDGFGLVVRLGPLLAFQVLLATEVAFTLTLAVAVALALTVLLVPARRSRVRSLLPSLLGGYAFAALLLSPFLYFLFAGFHRGGFNDSDNFLADGLNFVIPTKITFLAGCWASGISKRFPGNPSEQDAYLGLPTLLVVVLFAVGRFRSAAGRFLLTSLAVAVVLALGDFATVDGHRLVSLPWRLVSSLPLFDNVLTTRLAVYVALIAAVAVALWTAARRPGLLRVALPVLAVVAIVPNPAAGGFATRYDVPPFFTDSVYRGCIDPRGTVLPLPIRGFEWPLWQAQDGFHFNLAGGDIAPNIPPSFQTTGAMATVTSGIPVSVDQVDALRLFIAAKDVTTVVVDRTQASLWSGAMDQLATPEAIGGVVVYNLAGTGPAC